MEENALQMSYKETRPKHQDRSKMEEITNRWGSFSIKKSSRTDLQLQPDPSGCCQHAPHRLSQLDLKPETDSFIYW